MANKTLQTRISLKIDTWANWNTDAGKAHVLKRGEIAFVQIGNDIPPIDSTSNGTLTDEGLILNPNSVLYKIGDGKTDFEHLKWGSAIAADVYDWGKAATATYDAAKQVIQFKDAAGNVIPVGDKDGIDLSSLASDADLTALETKLTNLINSGGTANEQLAARVKAIEDDYTTAAQAETIAQGKADAVLGTKPTDYTGTAPTVYGVDALAKAAQSTANANATAIQGINNTINNLDSTYAKDSELTAKADELTTEINKKINSDDVYDKTAADGKFATISTVNGITSRVGANETAIGTINTTLAGLDAKFVDNDELASAKTELNTAIAKKVDQTVYDAKVKALDDEDDRLEGLIGGNTARIGALETASATHATKDELATGVGEAKDYTDEKIALVMNNSSEAVDSVMELAAAMKDNADAIDALNGIAATKASKSEFDAHVGADNPHGITPTKIGAYSTTEADNKFATLTAFEDNKTTVKEATHATNADNATNATKATQDGSGNVITDTYETKTVVNGIDTRLKAIEDQYLLEGEDDFLYIDGGRAPTA